MIYRQTSSERVEPENEARGSFAMIYRSLWFRILLLLYLLMCAAPLFAQVQILPLVHGQYFDANGKPLSNGCLFSYISGTNTPQATYTDYTGSVTQTNPVLLDASGRPVGGDVWLSGTAAYRLKLVSQGGVNCATGFTVWTEDGINPSASSLLASNNTWTGTNIFNGPVTFNTQPTFSVGLVSNGPNILNGGGTITGTWSGSPTFSGTPNFSGGFLATTGTFSGQIISTVATGTAPFVVASTTLVSNLNANFLEGADWASPGTIGSTTPNTGVFTTLKANTSFILNGSTAQVGVQGNDTKILSAGTVSGTGAVLCTDANGGATTSACPSLPAKIQAVKKTSSTCTPGSSASFDACTDTLTWPTAFADTNYVITCTGVQSAMNGGNPATNQAPILGISSYTTTQVVVITQQERTTVSNFTEIHCMGVHN